MDFFKKNSDKEETKPFLTDKDKDKDKVKANNGFGGKTIGFVGGFSLLVSNLTGPGLVSLSLVYQDAGWLYPTISLVIMMIMSTLSGVFLCEAMATIPGNESLQGRVEFATLARFYFGKAGHLISQVFINASLQSTNIAGIIISSQVMDSMFVGLFKRSCGVEIYPRAFHWVCVNSKSDDESPFGDVIMLFTIGYLVVMAIIIPLGYLNLDDNIIIQIAALIFLITVILDWIVTFSMTGLTNEVSAFTTAKQQAGVLGTVMFNFSFITTIPSWVNEKKPSVSVHKSLWSACVISTISFFLVGYLGSRAFGDMSASSDILSVINASRFSDIFSRILVYLFPLMVLATSIPVYSIIVRYNLLQNKVCSKFWANIFAVVIPWAVAIPFMKGGALNGLVNYSSLAFAASANFILPFIIYVRARNFRANLLKGLESMKLEQLEIIRSMHPEIDEEEVEKEKEKEKIMHYVVDAEEDEPDGAEERPIKDTKQQKQKQEEEQQYNHQQHLQENVPIPLPPTFRALGRFDERIGLSKFVAWASMGVMGVAIVVVIVCYSI